MADPATYRPAAGEIPTDPGVYRFRDEHGRVVYVGKARNLRSRLNSYFADPLGPAPPHPVDGDHGRLRRLGGRGAPRWRRSRSSTRGSSSTTRGSTSSTATTRATRTSPSRWGRRSRGRPSCARPSARAPATSVPTRTRGRSATPSTSSCASSRSAPAATGSSAGPRRWAGPACSATSTSAAPRASGGSSRTTTARWSRTSARSWPGQSETYVRSVERQMREASERQEYEDAARLPRPARRAHAGAGEERGRVRRQHRRGRHRHRRGRPADGGPGLPRARRADPRRARAS